MQNLMTRKGVFVSVLIVLAAESLTALSNGEGGERGPTTPCWPDRRTLGEEVCCAASSSCKLWIVGDSSCDLTIEISLIANCFLL